MGEGAFFDMERVMAKDGCVPDAGEGEGKRNQRDGNGESGFLSAGALEELEADKERAGEAENGARDEDVEDEEVGGDECDQTVLPAPSELCVALTQSIFGNTVVPEVLLWVAFP